MGTLTAEVAQRIVDRTMAVIGRNVNVMDDHGLILATGHPERLRMRHEGAQLAAENDREVVVDADQARLLKGVRPGVNVPLHHHGEVVGVVGISGDPREVQVYADLIRVAAELMVEQAGMLESGQLFLQEREDLLVSLATGRLVGDAAARRATGLGVVRSLLRRCTLVRPADEEGEESLRALQRQLGRSAEVLVARTGAGELAVWWPVGAPAAPAVVRRGLAVPGRHRVAADGEAFAGDDGLRRAWLTAQDALAVAHLAEDAYERRDLPLVALLCRLREDWRADAVAGPWLALVHADRHGELRATLRAWFEHDLHAGRCADALHIHRNTLRGRLERIERVTGLELRRVPSLVQLYVGPLLVADGDPTSS